MSQPGPAIPTAQEPMYQVRVMKHTGALIFWQNQHVTVTGGYAQCKAAIDAAQSHNYGAGWWSPASVLLWNWIAINTNRKAARQLDGQAYAYAAQYAAATGQPVPPPPPVRRSRWWLWIVVPIGALIGLIVLLVVLGALIGDRDSGTDYDNYQPPVLHSISPRPDPPPGN